MNIEIGNKPIDFVFQGDELIHPNYVAKDNLVLHYDFSGRTNLDVKKGIAEDLSGNGNDGILENFAYESGSGYDSNSYLEFDNVDDFITIPELNLDVNNFTVAVDGEVLSYRGDNVAKINENGLEIGGRNYFSLNEFQSLSPESWVVNAYVYRFNLEPNTEYTVSSNVPVQSGPEYTNIYFNDSGTSNSGVWKGRPVTKNSGETGELYIAIPTGRWQTNNLRNGVYWVQLENGNKATDWTPAPEDFQTTRITSFFSNKIKTLMYWNRALTDTELQEVYNVQKYRI